MGVPRIRLPQVAYADVVTVAPELVAVEVHADADAAIRLDRLLLCRQALGDALGERSALGGAGGVPADFRRARFLLRREDQPERLADEAVDGRRRLVDLRRSLGALISGQVEGFSVGDDRLPCQMLTGDGSQLSEPVGGSGDEHDEVAVEARSAVALGKDGARQRRRGGRGVVGVMGNVGRQYHEANAVVVVGHVAGAFGEHVQARECTARLGGDPGSDLVVGIAVGEVGSGAVGGDSGDVGLQ